MSLPPRKRSKHFWFGLLFIAGAFIPAGLAAACVWDWQRSRSWTSAQAEILSVELQSHRTHGPQGRTGSSLKLVAQYRYEPQFSQDTFQSDGISPFNRIEFFDSYVKKQAEKLQTAKRDAKTVTCYVNPEDPAEAFLNRDFRWAPFSIVSSVALLFITVGVLIASQGRSPS